MVGQGQQQLQRKPIFQISGTWYIKAIAAKKGILGKNVSPVILSLLSSGNIQASFTKRSNGQCHKIDMILEKTRVPGRYRTSGALHFLHMEGSSVRDHRLFFSELQFEGERFQVAKLMGRNPGVNTKALEEFKKFAQRKGFLKDDIFIPLQTESCSPEPH
ncbi:odorant-binding protein 2b-like isoform X2 [Sapajus apella]|uniref:Odorant-binding protein 2b-like isoform X2 n=1 Tax=Sapajus apella TaxID=9515 RepID=A0A6J3G7G9_SAPAP|nr:odorant-binding protein 2b-like isoform X2 [Sapajus apella]